MPRAFITGLSGTSITSDERAFLRDAKPLGLIVFRRNIETPAQLAALTTSFREIVGHDALVLVDQEGGRVQRLAPPHWPAYPPGRAYGDIYDRDQSAGLEFARLGARLMASDLHAAGIDVDCLPIADVPIPGADGVIGDRAYGQSPAKVAAIAGAVAEGLLQGGVLPVLKHLPGHGRANADSHLALPTVTATAQELECTDFAAFVPLNHLALGMTAHVVFSAIDPVAPATTSAIIVRDVIRGTIGFDGLLMCDDVSMQALSGTIRSRGEAAISAGCDVVLHCNGDLAEMTDAMCAAPMLSGIALQRAARALTLRVQPDGGFDVAGSRARFEAMLAEQREVMSS